MGRRCLGDSAGETRRRGPRRTPGEAGESPRQRRPIAPQFAPLPAVAPGSRDPILPQSHRRAAAKTSHLFLLALCRPPILPVLHGHRVGDHGGTPSRELVPASIFLSSIALCPARLPHSRGGPVHSPARSAPLLQATGARAAATSLAAPSARPSGPGLQRSTGPRANENSNSPHFLHRPLLFPQCRPST